MERSKEKNEADEREQEDEDSEGRCKNIGDNGCQLGSDEGLD